MTGAAEGRGARAAQTSLHLCKVGQKVDIFSFINHLSGSHRLTRQKQRANGRPPSGARIDQTSTGRPVINYTNGIKLGQLGKYASQY